MSENKQALLTVFIIWNSIGLFIGACDSWNERDGVWDPYVKVKRQINSGCVYTSIASFTNLGYLASCEIFRERFKIDGILK